jgi:YVTN family beta-propeller protein
MVKSLALLYLLGSILCGDVFAQNQTVTNGSVTAPIPFTGAGCTFNWTNDQPSIGLAVSGVGNIASFTATNTGSTPVVATITVAPVSQFYAYIPNEQDNTVSVVNAVSGSIVATVPVGELPDAESVSPDGSTVYISNEASDNVSVISTATNTVIATIPIGFSARGIVVNHAGTMVYVADGRDVKVISTATNTVVGTLSSGAPVGITIDPSDAYVYTVEYASPGIVK